MGEQRLIHMAHTFAKQLMTRIGGVSITRVGVLASGSPALRTITPQSSGEARIYPSLLASGAFAEERGYATARRGAHECEQMLCH